VVVDDQTQEFLGLAVVSRENSPERVEKLHEIAAQVGAEALVSDDLDSYKEVATQLEVEPQIRRKHIQDNLNAWVEELFQRLPQANRFPQKSVLTPT
jgi:hypothetical protein